MKRAILGLNKAQKERLVSYLSILEDTIIVPPSPLKISKRVKDRAALKHRNYKHAIEIIRHLINPTINGIDFKSNKQYEYSGEVIHVHRKSRQSKVRKIPQCKQLKAVQSLSA